MKTTPEREPGSVRKRRAAKAETVEMTGPPATAALYLAAAGVGTLGIVDFDAVDLSNLQRQILHHVRDVGRPKVQSAVDTIADLKSGCEGCSLSGGAQFRATSARSSRNTMSS